MKIMLGRFIHSDQGVRGKAFSALEVYKFLCSKSLSIKSDVTMAITF